MRLRGNILLLFSLSLPIFTGIAFFFADLGYAFYIQNKMNNVTRRVALTAIQPWIYFYSPTSPPGGGTIASFQDIARKYFALEFPGITYDTPLTITQISSTVYRLKVGIKSGLGSFPIRTFRKQIDIDFDKNIELVLAVNQGVSATKLTEIKTGAKNIIDKINSLPFFKQKMFGIIPYANTIAFTYPYLPAGFSNQNATIFSLNSIDSESFKQYPFLNLSWSYTVNNTTLPNIHYYSNNPEDYVATIFSPSAHCTQLGDPNHGVQIIGTPITTYPVDPNFLVSGPPLDGIYDHSDDVRNMGSRYIGLYPNSSVKYGPDAAKSPTSDYTTVKSRIDDLTSKIPPAFGSSSVTINLPNLALSFAWYMLSPKWQGLWLDKLPAEKASTPLASSAKNKKFVIIFMGNLRPNFSISPASASSSTFGNDIANYNATSLIPGPYHYPNMLNLNTSPRYNQNINLILNDPTYGTSNSNSYYNKTVSNLQDYLSFITWNYSTFWYTYRLPANYNEFASIFFMNYLWQLGHGKRNMIPWISASWNGAVGQVDASKFSGETNYKKINWGDSASQIFPTTGDGSFNLANYLILKEFFLRKKMTSRGNIIANNNYTLPYTTTNHVFGHSMKCEGYTNAVCFNSKDNKTQNNGSTFFMPKYDFKVGWSPYDGMDPSWTPIPVMPVDTYRRQIFTRNTTGCVYTFIDTIKFWYDFIHTYYGISQFLSVLNFQGYTNFPLQPCPIPSDTNYNCTLAQQNVYYSTADTTYKGTFANQTVDGVKYTYPNVGTTVPFNVSGTYTVTFPSGNRTFSFNKWNHNMMISLPHMLALVLGYFLGTLNSIGQDLINRETFLLRNFWSPYGYLYPYGVTINGVKYTDGTSAANAIVNEVLTVCNLMKNNGIKVGFILDSSLAANSSVGPSLLQSSSSLMPNGALTGNYYVYGQNITDATYKGLFIATSSDANIPLAANQMAEMIAEMCSEGTIINDFSYFT